MTAVVGSLRSALETDRAGLRWIAPLRSALVCALAVALAVIFDEAKHATPLAIGALFAGLSDPRGTLGMRSRAIVLVALLNALAGAIGALVATSYGLHVAAAAVVSLGCGYLGVVGPRSATTGVLALVVFIVFSGTVYVPAEAPLVALLLIAGASLQAVFSLAPALTRRLGAVRGDISIAYRALALTFGRRYLATGSGSLAAKIAQSRELISESGVRGETRRWLDDLVETCERVRVGTFLLEHRESDALPGEVAFVGRYFAAAVPVCFGISSALEIPMLRGRVRSRVEALEEILGSAPDLPEEVWLSVRAIHADLLRAAALVQRTPWPVGRAFGVGISLSAPHEDLSRLRRRTETTDLFLRHAIRLSAVITLTTALTQVDGFQHSYWLPMTVAWVMKPDLAGSATRLAARLAGTLIGAFVFVGLIEALGSGAVATAMIVGTAAFFVYAFIQTNYAVCTAGATVLFFTLVTFAGNPAISSAASRVGLTLLAGICVSIAVLIVPTRSIGLAYDRLGKAADRLADYVDTVRHGVTGQGLIESRAAAAMASIEAGDVIKAVGLEPGDSGTSAREAATALERLISASSYAAALELAPGTGDRVELTGEGVDAMRSIGADAEVLGRGGRLSTEPQFFSVRDPANPFEREVRAARKALSV